MIRAAAPAACAFRSRRRRSAGLRRHDGPGSCCFRQVPCPHSSGHRRICSAVRCRQRRTTAAADRQGGMRVRHYRSVSPCPARIRPLRASRQRRSVPATKLAGSHRPELEDRPIGVACSQRRSGRRAHRSETRRKCIGARGSRGALTQPPSGHGAESCQNGIEASTTRKLTST